MTIPPFLLPARQSLNRAPLLVLLAAGCISLVVGWMLVQLRQDTWRSAKMQGQNVAHLLAQDLARTIESYDLSLIGVADGLALPGLDAVPADIARAAVFDNSVQAKYFGIILVLDRDGNVTRSSLPGKVPALNNADRDYFIAQRDRPNAGFFISRPYTSRISGEEVIGLSRRLSNPDGSFAGVVVGHLTLSYFRELLAKLHISPEGSLSIFREDGTLLMREPFAHGDIGRSIAASDTFKALNTSRQGTFVGISAIDGVKRLYAFEHLANAPIFVDAAFGVDALLSAWWHKAIAVLLIVIGLSAMIVALVLRSEREVARRRLAEERLTATAAELARLSETDGLTGLANRRRFDAALSQELKRASRSGTPVSLVLMDADFFKAYNDSHGHLAGDAALRAVATCIRAAAQRDGDLPGRLGGEEFGVILPDTDRAGALRVSQAIQAAMAARALLHQASPTGHLTLSIGIATVSPGLCNDPAALFGVADAALYTVKNGGRNGIEAVDMLPHRRPTAQAS